MSIVRVFPFARDFVTFPRLLFWRLPPLAVATPSPSSHPFFPVTPPPLSLPAVSSSLPALSRWLCRGDKGRDLAIVELFLFFRSGGGIFGRWRPLLRGKYWNSTHNVFKKKFCYHVVSSGQFVVLLTGVFGLSHSHNSTCGMMWDQFCIKLLLFVVLPSFSAICWVVRYCLCHELFQRPFVS